MPFIDFFRSRKLKFKILLLFALILVLPLAILMAVTLERISLVARQDLNRNLGYAGSLFRNSLEDQLDSLKIRAKTVADFDFYTLAGMGFSASATVPLMQYELIRSGLDYIAIVENRSNILIEEGTTPSEALAKIIPAMCHTPLNVNLFVIADEPWIFAAAMITKLKTELPQHVLFAQRLPRDFADKLKRLTGAEYTLLYAGKRILTSQMDIYARRKTGKSPEDPDVNSGQSEILGKSHFFVRDEVLKGRISETIRLEIALPDSEYNVLGQTMRRDFIIFGLLGLVLALVTGTVLSWHIASPINLLAESTSKVAAGDLSPTADLSRSDEIGLLSRNFREMVISIRQEKDLKEQRMSELNTLFAISNAVNFFSDSEELLKFVLTHAIEVLEAERGSIMLLDDQTDELMVKVASGGRYRVFSGTPIRLGQGVCGQVALDGQGLICNEGFKDSRFRNFGSLMPVEDIKSLICSPLKFKEGTIGVINIVNKRNSTDFRESDLSLLNLIASQAAVTIENNKLYELSITDGMTRLFVHRYFQARLSEELLRARRYGLTLSLIMIDIDNFKKFNDTYGHQIGDIVIQKVAQSIKETVRTGIDIPCRYGGEEMSVILPETRPEEALQTAERLRERIAALSLAHSSGELRITVSIGVSSYPVHSHDRESLIKTADKALYVSKGAGKNRSTLACEDHQA
ncbi:MAG: diguanylate cyclase [Candidatus Riflebacteria bacterium]|nr:diguanylate cyclase [Candidatus Riflebacteria bacterium]